MKVIRVTMPDGSKWDVPASHVAGNRAKYYASKVSNDPFSFEFERERKCEHEYAMSDDSELIDWAANNMNWCDVRMFAKQHSPATEIDYQDGWCNGDKEVIEVE